MMGHRERLKGGDEYDALTRWRRFLGFRAGARRWIKRRFSKRVRHAAKAEAGVWMAEVRAWAASFPQVEGGVDCDRGVLNERGDD